MTRSRNKALDELSTSKDQAEKRSDYYKKYDEVIEKFTELIELGIEIDKTDDLKNRKQN